MSQILYYIQIGLFIFFCDQAHHGCVVRKLDDGVGVESCYTVVCVQGYSRGLKIQPWGSSVLRMRVEEVHLPTVTTWGLPVKKSGIHMHSEVFIPRSLSFVTSLEVIMVLNTEL